MSCTLLCYFYPVTKNKFFVLGARKFFLLSNASFSYTHYYNFITSISNLVEPLMCIIEALKKFCNKNNIITVI